MTTCRTSMIHRQFFRVTPCYGSTTIGLRPPAIPCSNPDRAMASGYAGGDADARHSRLYRRRASWVHGDWRPRPVPGRYRPQRQRARCPPCRGPKSERAVVCFLQRGTQPPGNSADNERRLSAGLPVHLPEHFPDPSCGFPADVKEAERTRRSSAGRQPARHSLDRYCRPWCQMCRTFQKSSVNSVVRPCRDRVPGRFLRSRSAGCLRGRHR